MTNKFVSFYFDTSSQPFTYGACVWSGSAQYMQAGQKTLTSDTRHLSVKDIRIQLQEVATGAIALRDLAEFVSSFSKPHLTVGTQDKIILEKLPEMTVLEKTLKQHHKIYSVELVERDSSLSEQIAKYSMMINRDRFYIDDGLLVEPDLIFDEIASQNIIDPVFTDEQTSFPMTQALLVGCHYLETIYRSTHTYVAGTLKNPFSSDGRFPQRRDYSRFNRF